MVPSPFGGRCVIGEPGATGSEGSPNNEHCSSPSKRAGHETIDMTVNMPGRAGNPVRAWTLPNENERLMSVWDSPRRSGVQAAFDSGTDAPAMRPGSQG